MKSGAQGLLALLLATAAGCRCHPDPAAPAKPVFCGFALEGNPITHRQVADLPRDPDLILFYLQWPAPGQADHAPFPRESLDIIRDAGAVPCVTWEPMYVEAGRETAIPATLITHGAYDGYLRRFAEEAVRWRDPILLRFAHEMNLSRYHWGTSEAEFGPDSPGHYRAMFRHVVDVTRAAGATNLLWVFCPNSESVPSPATPSLAWNAATNYYPGDDVVDLLGLDGYNWGHSRTQARDGWTSSPRTFAEIFEQPARDLRALVPSKPLIVFETASVGTPLARTQWFESALRACSRLDIRGLTWFQADKENCWILPGKRSDTGRKTTGDNAGMSAWIREMRK